LNPHALRHRLLRPTCLPVPPPRQRAVLMLEKRDIGCNTTPLHFPNRQSRRLTGSKNGAQIGSDHGLKASTVPQRRISKRPVTSNQFSAITDLQQALTGHGATLLAPNLRAKARYLPVAGILAAALHWPLMAWSRRRKVGLSVVAMALVVIIVAPFLLPKNDEDEEVRAAYDRVQIGMTPAQVTVAIYPNNQSPAAWSSATPGWEHFEITKGRLRISLIPPKIDSTPQRAGTVRVRWDKNLKVDAKRIESRIWWWDMILQSIGM
jgi:hypothetical protein